MTIGTQTPRRRWRRAVLGIGTMSLLVASGCSSGPENRSVGGSVTNDAASNEGDGAPPDGAPAPFSCDGTGARFVTDVVAHHFGDGQNTGQALFPTPILGPPKGGGACQGSTDVVSLGNGGFVVVAFAGNEIVDEPGPDFTVFENPFGIGCDLSNIFAELATVGVSEDGVSFVDFPCTAVAPPYGQCAGWHPVYANADADAGTIDPLDPTVSGGDTYDLADVGLSRARYVRIVDRPDLTGTSGVFDLDAMSIVHAACP